MLMITMFQRKTEAKNWPRQYDGYMHTLDITHTRYGGSEGEIPEQLKPVLDLQRKAQWRLDFVNAENSMGFHAPQEAARILGESIDYSRQAQIMANGLGKKTE